jgi:hypothetical protein
MSGEPYRPDWWDTNRTLPQIAMDVVMTARGSFERSQEDQEADVKRLIHAVAHWRESDNQDARHLGKLNRDFDEHVRRLCWTAVYIGRGKR